MKNSKVTKTHIPVMLTEAVEKLKIKPEGFYIDCTLGEGGHSHAILESLNDNGMLVSIDRDQEAIDFVHDFYADSKTDNRWKILKGNFSEIESLLKSAKINQEPNGILMDLGMSSRQLDVEKRGFSYQEATQDLDMRMDKELGVKAKDLINGLNEKELTKLFLTYGEERNASKFAKAIKNSAEPIETVGDLLKSLSKVVPNASAGQKSPARRVFQALRIAVNDELNSLEKGLADSYKLLAPKGRLVVITFHSLEDRIVKKFSEKNGLQITKTPLLPKFEEIIKNKRAHSAKLRVIEKNNI